MATEHGPLHALEAGGTAHLGYQAGAGVTLNREQAKSMICSRIVRHDRALKMRVDYPASPNRCNGSSINRSRSRREPRAPSATRS